MNDYEREEYNRQYMGKIPETMENLHYFSDGRYLISFTRANIVIGDLFHSKLRNLLLDISAATNKGIPLKTGKEYEIKSFFACDLNTILIAFKFCSSRTLYLGVGQINLEDSVVIVKKTSSIPTDYDTPYRLFPLSHPPNLSEGMVLLVDDWDPRYTYFTIKMEDNNHLRISSLDVPGDVNLFGCFNGYLYGLADSDSNNTDISLSTDLVKVSLSNGQHVRQPTKMDHNYYDYYWFMSTSTEKDEILTLDLETLKWKHTNIEFDDLHSFSGNGTQTLMISTPSTGPLKYNIYRFAVNQPDKLSTLAWLRLKRIFDARPSAYKFILSRLPANFKQKCPFPRTGNHNMTNRREEIEEQIRERFTRLSEKTTISFELKKRSKVVK